MYLAPSAIEEKLRQGDVIRGVLLPRFSLSDIRLISRSDPGGNPKFDGRTIVTTGEHFAVVLSHCCEFNTGKRRSFSMSALRPLRDYLGAHLFGDDRWGINVAELVALARSPYKGKNTKQTLELLRKANKVDLTSGTVDAANLFLYDQDGDNLGEPYVADFTRVTSLSMKDSQEILSRKVLQLDDEHRRMLKIKLGVFYSRSV